MDQLNENPSALEVKKTEILNKITAAINYSQELLDIFSGELQITNELILQQVEVSEMFSDFHEIWRELDFNQNIDGFLMFQAIDADVHRLSDILDTFETRAQRASEILRGIMTRFTTHLRELEEIQRICEEATNVEELDNVTLPDLSSLEHTEYPDLVQLTQEWNECNIYAKLNRCIEDLESLTF